MVRILVVLVIALAVALPYAGSFLVVDRPLPSDVIVVLAGDEGSSRFSRGVKALKSGLGRELFVDADSRNLIYGKTMAQMAQAYIQTMPPEQAAHIHVCPIISTSTFAETAEVVRCIEPLHPQRVLLVTSDYHTRRSLSIFARRVPQYAWSVAAAMTKANFGRTIGTSGNGSRQPCRSGRSSPSGNSWSAGKARIMRARTWPHDRA